METRKRFNKRAFVSIGMLVSGITLPVSGFLNHIFGFEALTPARHFWMSVHNISAVLFLVFAIIHINLNFHSVKNYFNKYKETLISKEALTAIALVLAIMTLFSLHILAAE